MFLRSLAVFAVLIIASPVAIAQQETSSATEDPHPECTKVYENFASDIDKLSKVYLRALRAQGYEDPLTLGRLETAFREKLTSDNVKNLIAVLPGEQCLE